MHPSIMHATSGSRPSVSAAGGDGAVEILYSAEHDCHRAPQRAAKCSGSHCGTPRVAHVQELVLSFSEHQNFLKSVQ